MATVEERMAAVETEHAVTRQQITDHLKTCGDRYTQSDNAIKDTRREIGYVKKDVTTLSRDMNTEFKSVRRFHVSILLILIPGLLGVIGTIAIAGM